MDRQRQPGAGDWGWFLVWAAVGASSIAFISFAGFLYLPVAGAALFAALRWGRHAVSGSAFGAAAGAGLPFLLVAYVQRKGPGTVCWHTATAAGCDDYLDPRPWLAIGLVLVLAGVVGFLHTARRVQRI
ncbi:MAG: hypothetical protein ACTHNU_04265 [Gaiellales bacterium]